MRNIPSKLLVTMLVALMAPQIAAAAWWNPGSWFVTEAQHAEQEQSNTLASSSTQEKPQTADTSAPSTKTIEGLREEVALLKARLADLESRFSSTQTGTAVQSALTVVDVSPRIAALEKRLDALSNLDTSRLTKLEQKVAELSKVPANSAPTQAKNYDAQISEMAKRINALMHANTNTSSIHCLHSVDASSFKVDNPGPTCSSIFNDLKY